MDSFGRVIPQIMESFDGDEVGKLFVGGLSWNTTHFELLNYFRKFGEVVDCVVMKNQQTGNSRGFGFVKFKDPSNVDLVLLNGPHVIDGTPVDPKNCNPRRLNQGGKSAENSKRKVFIGGLPSTCDEAQLKEVFRIYGAVEDATIMYDQEKNRSRGFGFLTFEAEASVDKVCSKHYFQINGKQVECKRAEPRQVKSMADNGSPIILTHPGAQGMVVGMTSPGASSIVQNLSQGSINGASSQQLPSPVGAAMQHPGGIIAGAGMMLPYNPAAAAFGGPGLYCLHDQGLQFHPALGPHAIQGVIGLPGGIAGGVPTAGLAAAAAGIAGSNMQQAGVANTAAMQGAGVSLSTGTGDSGGQKNMQVCGPAEAFPHVRQISASGAESASGGGAQISFQPQVTYTLAPGATAFPAGFAPIFPGNPAAMQAAGDASGGPQYLQHIQPSTLGRIATNHAFLPHFHPYRR